MSVEVRVKMSPLQQGAMYMENIELRKQRDALIVSARELIHWCENAESTEEALKMLAALEDLKARTAV